jgi:tetratricopeptide (TPR) repeat protein
MEKMEYLERVHRLEEEIELLKTQLQPKRRWVWLLRVPQRFAGFLITNWALVSFLLALLTLLYVKVVFDVDYFEDYRNISTTKKLSEFYRQLGDRMMADSEWKAAEDAYRSALEVNPHNVEATYGIAKAQVFQPLEGETYYAPEVVDVKLDYLLSVFPDDYQLYFLKGTQYLLQGDNDNAESWFRKAVDKNPSFAAGYISLGYTYQRDLDFEEAIENFETALELDPDSANAHNNLGYMYILLARYELAIEHLETAYSLSPRLLTALNLGDAYRHAGNFSAALRWHQFALSAMGEPGVESERYVGGRWLFNYMPEEPGDLETTRYYVEVGSVTQKRIFLHYALSIDYALNGDFEAAEREFETANQLDLSQQYNGFFVNRISSIENSLELSGDTLDWFEEHKLELLFSM